MLPKFEWVVKIELAPFSAAVGLTFAQNFGITQERLVVEARRRHHRFSCKIFLKNRSLLQKLSNRQKLSKMALLSLPPN